MDKMSRWREGYISDSEVMTYLLSDLFEINAAIQERETKTVDKRLLAKLGVKPFQESIAEIIKRVKF